MNEEEGRQTLVPFQSPRTKGGRHLTSLPWWALAFVKSENYLLSTLYVPSTAAGTCDTAVMKQTPGDKLLFVECLGVPEAT